jgi:hypothetical protein
MLLPSVRAEERFLDYIPLPKEPQRSSERLVGREILEMQSVAQQIRATEQRLEEHRYKIITENAQLESLDAPQRTSTLFSRLRWPNLQVSHVSNWLLKPLGQRHVTQK